MPAPISTIVNVQITQETSTVPQASFSIPAIFGPSTILAAPGDFEVYTSLAGMVADGYTTANPEFIRAQELVQQALVPVEWVVARYNPSVAQVDTFQVGTLVTGHEYTFTLNGLPISYTSIGGDTQQSVLNSLLTAISVAFPVNPPVGGAVVGTGAGATLTLTGLPGVPVVYTLIDVDLTHVALTPVHSIVTDIQTEQASPGGDIWYGLTICSQASGDIQQVAAYIETQIKIFVADSADANILNSAVSTDVASILKGKSYKRTAVLYSGTANDGAAAAWLGGQLPQVPGASTWKFKQLVGITPDSLTANQRNTCIGLPGIPEKNCNIYDVVGGVPITEEGFMAGGQFIDITLFIDWLVSTMQVNVYTLLVQAPKIPYTAQGISIIENAVRQTLNQGISNGGIDGNSPVTVNVPAVADIPVSDRAERVLPDVTFSCRLAGAIHFVEIQGTVSV